MHVGFGLVGHFVVDDVSQLVYVDAASGNVSGNQHAGSASFEIAKGALTVVLALVAVDGFGRNLGFLQGFGHLVSAVLGAGKYQHALDGGVFQDMAQ